jgi:predicted Zn-dependent peptidase
MIIKEVIPTIFELENGIRVVHLPTVSTVSHLGFTVLAGSRNEKKGQEGLAHFLEHCIFKGTSKRKAYHILSGLDSVGGELNAYTNKEEICVYGSFTNEHLKRAADLISDITLNASFPEKELEKEKEVILDEINSYLDAPSDRIFDDFESYLFPNHSLGNNILGTKQTVENFCKNDVESYRKSYFLPQNCVISYVGNAGLKQVKAILERYFGAYQNSGKATNPAVFESYKPFGKVEAESNFQAHGLIGGLAPGYKDDTRRAAALLMNLLCGPALNSRLNLNVREKYGYAYSIDGSFNPYRELGYWNIYFGCDQKHLKKSHDLVKKELQVLCNNRLTETQLHRAKVQFKGQIALANESNAGQMISLGKSVLVFNKIDTMEQIYAGIDKTTSSELLEMANCLFDPSGISSLMFEVKK